MKKNFLNVLALFAITTTMVSCYTYETVTKYRYESVQDDYNRKYKGCTKTQIINEFGAPSRIVPIDDSSFILVYEKVISSISQPIDPFGLGIGNYTETKNRIFAEFYMDGNSKCYNVKTNGIKEVPYQETVKKNFFDY